jgi:hypothetical protein
VVVSPKISDLEKKINEAEQNLSAGRAAVEQTRERRKAALDAIQKFLDIIRGLNPSLRITASRESSAHLSPDLYKRKRARPEIIGHSTYTIAPHQRTRVRMHLTRSATRFLRKWKWLNVGIAITEPGPSGKLRVKTKIVTLKARTHKKKPTLAPAAAHPERTSRTTSRLVLASPASPAVRNP